MTLRKNSTSTRAADQLGVVDRAVLEAHQAGSYWKTVPGMRSEARFRRTLARARWRQSQQA